MVGLLVLKMNNCGIDPTSNSLIISHSIAKNVHCQQTDRSAVMTAIAFCLGYLLVFDEYSGNVVELGRAADIV